VYLDLRVPIRFELLGGVVQQDTGKLIASLIVFERRDTFFDLLADIVKNVAARFEALLFRL
jgi:hypothetical protein